MNIPFRILFTCLLSVFCLQFIHAQDSHQNTKDSLLNAISTSEKKAKLEAYFDYVNYLYYNEENIDITLAAFADFEKEALRQKEYKYAATSRSNIIKVLDHHSMYDKLFKRADSDLQFIANLKQWDSYFTAYSDIIFAYMQTGQKEKALEEVKKCNEQAEKVNTPMAKARAAFTMGIVCAWSNRANDAQSYFLQAISEADKDKDGYEIKKTIYAYLFQIYANQGKYEDLAKLLKKWEKDLEARKRTNPDNDFSSDLSNIRIGYARYYLTKKNWDKMEYYCRLVESFPASASALNAIKGYRIHAEIARKNYVKALEYAKQVTEYSINTNDVIGQYTGLREQAHALIYMNRPEECENILDSALVIKDTIASREFAANFDELRTQYEVEKLTAEKEINQQRWIIALSTSILLLILLAVYMLYSRRLKRKNQTLFQQIQELTQKEKVIEQCLRSTPEETLSQEMLLFRRVSECLLTDKLFTNSELNRRKLADMVGTNETYLADAIRNATGDTFTSFISNLRLQYALEIFDTQSDISLDNVAIDTGYGSYSPFYRAFVKKYGITPSEYRKLSKTKGI